MVAMALTPHPTVWYRIDQKNFEKKLRGLLKRGHDLRPAFHTIGRMFRQSRKTIFRLKSSGGYPDLSPRYKLQKQKEVGFTYPILKKGQSHLISSKSKSYGLADSVTNIRHPNNITIVHKKEFAFGTNVPYAKYHNSGKTPRRKIPLRKFVFWGEEAPRTMRNMTDATKKFSGRALAVIRNFIAREKTDLKRGRQ